MINNKGQTLVIFVVFLPLLIIIMATVIDISLMYYEKNKLDNLNMMVIEYAVNNINDEDIENKISKLVEQNDKNIKYEIKIENNNITLILDKTTESTFGKIIGIDEYKIKSIYNGNKEEIKKG